MSDRFSEEMADLEWMRKRLDNTIAILRDINETIARIKRKNAEWNRPSAQDVRDGK